jgi:lactoylglutathione lyase
VFTEAFPIVTVADLPAAIEFYRDRLGFAETYRFPQDGEPVFVTLRIGTSELGLGADPDATAIPGYELCVYTADCDAAVEELRAAGTPVVDEPADQPWGERTARVTDPAGNRVLILSRL